MENGRRLNWDNCRQEVPRRRSQGKKPPRGSWQPTVPSWEKEFCKVVGSLDWETLLQLKKFTHLCDNVVMWNDSAGEEAFCNAKRRFWAQINGFPCEVELPNPDLYIDDIKWDMETDPELSLNLDTKPAIPYIEENIGTVVFFGDSLVSNQEFSPSGWGDEEENVKVPDNLYSANNANSWENNWDNSFNNEAAVAWSGFCDNVWHFSNGIEQTGYMPRASGWDNSWGWNYDNNLGNYEVGHEILPDNRACEEQHDYNFPSVNSGRNSLSNKTWMATKNDLCMNDFPKDGKGWRKPVHRGEQSAMAGRSNSRKLNPYNSCVPVTNHTGITLERTWNKGKHVS
ncbi:uncharacterized protein LOC142552070 [Primulina tabacum]|uniref:uncharacterized protein LOC142552070 n=1 Tax=Primulina tabacum TaxID=48773 RepID=UPI003F59535E